MTGKCVCCCVWDNLLILCDFSISPVHVAHMTICICVWKGACGIKCDILRPFPVWTLDNGSLMADAEIWGCGSGFLTLAVLQTAILEWRGILSEKYSLSGSANTASPLFLINLATGIYSVRDLWWVCMFYILSSELPHCFFFVKSGRAVFPLKHHCVCGFWTGNHAFLKLRLLKAVISLFLCPPVISVKGGLCGFFFNQFGD